MKRFAFIFLLLAAPTARAVRCQILIQEMGGNPLSTRAAIDLSPLATSTKGPSIAILNGKAFLLDDRFLESSESGVLSAPAEHLHLTVPSARGKEALNNPTSVAITPWAKQFIFFLVGANGSLHVFSPTDVPRSYRSAWIPKPKACGRNEKPASVRLFEWRGAVYLYLATTRGNIFRTALHAHDGQRPDKKWELVAQDASPYFSVLGWSDFAYLDKLGSIYLQTGKTRDWLGHFPGAVTSFSAHVVPPERSIYSRLEDRLVVWMTALNKGQPDLYRWHMLAGIRKARVQRPASFGNEVPLAVSSIHEDAGRLQERVLLLAMHEGGAIAQPFRVHLHSGDSWVRPQWWQEDLPKPQPARTHHNRRPSRTDVADAVIRNAHLPVPQLVSQFLQASGVEDPKALITAFRTLSYPDTRPGHMPILQITDYGLLAHMLTAPTEQVLATLLDSDLRTDFQQDSPIRPRPGQKAFDARNSEFPFESRKWVALVALFSLTHQFLGQDPWSMYTYWLDQVESMPGYGEMEFWEFLDLVYERLRVQRRLKEDER
jgi:hypothetical protein